MDKTSDLKKISKSRKDRSRDYKKSSKRRDNSREDSALNSRERSASKSRDRSEKHGKMEKSKKDDAQTTKKKSTSKKNRKTFNDKIEKEVEDKEHKLDECTVSEYENPEREAYYSSESTSSENSSSENSDSEDDDNDKGNRNSNDVDMNDDDDEFEQTQPLFEKTTKKRKALLKNKIEQNEIKKIKLKKQINDLFQVKNKLEKLLVDWDKKCLTSTSDIDYKAWQLSHSARDVYFIAPDGYVYPNQSTMKKVSDAVKKKEIDEKTIASLVPPIKRIVAVNPRITFGITGLRYIGSGGGFGVQTIFYVAKEYMNDKDQTSGSLKLVKVQIPITALDNFGKAVKSAIEIMEEVNPKKGDNGADE